MGFVELVIKVYFKGVNEKFPDGGVMSQHMESLKLGDKARGAAQRCARPLSRAHPDAPRALRPQLTFSGPKGRYTYKGRGVFAVKQLPSQARTLAAPGVRGCAPADAALVSPRRAAARSYGNARAWA